MKKLLIVAALGVVGLMSAKGGVEEQKKNRHLKKMLSTPIRIKKFQKAASHSLCRAEYKEPLVATILQN
ncbi:hypothetical protein IMZ16_05340 [Cruoricaptor ignavus]|uniref:Uncharacterized protein n=1 Tax=Cruoricaptor ignavus TaxID=1118202 RepID=A0A7M1T1F1_9FLAO|nr:hypothetical protein [Cruoricaptor ignavus]QOR72974.1 hypothetical protein IMZ16_05340 [Cruoricaptor ignavus]